MVGRRARRQQEEALKPARRVLKFQKTGNSNIDTEGFEDLQDIAVGTVRTAEEALALSVQSLLSHGQNQTATNDPLQFVNAGPYVAAPDLENDYVLAVFARAGFRAALVNEEHHIYKVEL